MKSSFVRLPLVWVGVSSVIVVLLVPCCVFGTPEPEDTKPSHNDPGPLAKAGQEFKHGLQHIIMHSNSPGPFNAATKSLGAAYLGLKLAKLASRDMPMDSGDRDNLMH